MNIDICNSVVSNLDTKNLDISNTTVTDKQAEILHKMIEMVMRQTEYNYNEAKEKLLENDWKYDVVIKKYMGINLEKKEECKTVNQEIFKQIRKHMDSASSNYYK